MRSPVARCGILRLRNGSRHLTLFNSTFPKRRFSYLLTLHRSTSLFSVSRRHRFPAIGVCRIKWHVRVRAGTRAPSLACHWINESLCVSILCPCSSERAVHMFVLRIYRKVSTSPCWNEVGCPEKTNIHELNSCDELQAWSCRCCRIEEAPQQWCLCIKVVRSPAT